MGGIQIMNAKPLISVILPVYNAGKYLETSIKSILTQTLSDFEFIILNDGSTDNSEEIILSFNDSRIRYYKHNNSGLAATLNRGIELSRGEYIARQDQDDISLPERFIKQIDFFRKKPHTMLLGTRARVFTDDGATYGYHNHPILPGLLKLDLMFNNPFVHSSVMFKKSVLQKTGVYTTDKNYFEDYHLWSRMALMGDVYNLPDVLVEYRHHEKSLSKGSSYFAGNALYSQCVMNLEALTHKKEQVIRDIPAMIHREYTYYQGTSKKEMLSALKEIVEIIAAQYPENKKELYNRLLDYESMLISSYDSFLVGKYRNNKLMSLSLRIKSRLFNYVQRLKRKTK